MRFKLDKILKKIQHDIDKTGWHVLSVASDHPSDHYCYTIGLYKSFGMPEIVMKGLPIETMHTLVNDVVKSKPDFSKIDEKYILVQGLLRNNLDLCLQKLDYDQIKEHIFYCSHVNSPNTFSVCQLYWPDTKNNLPISNECDSKVQQAQKWEFNDN